jgi:hypothetical protein
MTHWIVRHRETGEEQMVRHDDGYPPYNAVDYEAVHLPRELGPEERWDWEAAAIVSRFTPAEAAAIMWERAKAYRDERSRGGFTLPGIGVVQTRDQDREAITRLAKRAEKKVAAGEPEWTTSFINEANEEVPVDIPAILFVDDAVDLFLAAIHARSQGIRGEIDAAATLPDATAEDIFAIDITAGYPAGPISPPTPPQEES